MKKEIAEREMLKRLQPGSILLSPLVIRSFEGPVKNSIDACIEVDLPQANTPVRFVVESKSGSTPEAVQAAIAKAKAASGVDALPMIQVPFLGPDRLEFLEKQQVSGVDLCGNGVVIVPNRIWIIRSGNVNQYRESRPLNNPFRGRSAMVARTLIAVPEWPSMKKMLQWMRDSGAELSPPQVSKALRALEEELLVSKHAGTIRLQDPQRMLDKLASEWRKPEIWKRQGYRISPGDTAWSARLSSDPTLRWAATGESSASRYAMFSQGGARRIAVSDLQRAASLLNGTPEPIPNFAEVELIETDAPGLYFQSITDEKGMRWASRLQTWLELQAGDARQQQAALDIRAQILREANQ